MTYEDGPSPLLLREIERVATELAAEGGRIAVSHFRQPLTVEFKGADGRNPVTQVDRLVEDFLRGRIMASFPSHCVLGEEGGDIGPAGADFVWVLDPIDGTNNFIAGLPFFSVSIGVLHRGEPVVAALYVSFGPRMHDDVLHARRGGGCFLAGERVGVYQGEFNPSHPASIPPSVRGDTVTGKVFRRHPVEARTIGSIANELALVAAGALQFAIYLSPRIWDVAGGILLIKEAGGAALQWDSKESAWVTLDRFQHPPTGNNGAANSLRDWSRSVLAGAPTSISRIGARTHPRGRIDSLLRRWLWYKLT